MKEKQILPRDPAASRSSRGRLSILCVFLILTAGVFAALRYKSPNVLARPAEEQASAASADQAQGPDADFARRCHSPGVVKCAGFDSPREIAAAMYNDSQGQ